MSDFFITGLPRTRTAWMAQYMSWNGVLCLHEPTAGAATIEDAQAKFCGIPRGASDSGLVWFTDAWRKAFPDAKWVVIRRDVRDVHRSMMLAMRRCGIATDDAQMEETLRLHQQKVEQCILECDPLVVEYADIDARMAEIAAYCVPGWKHSEERHRQMLRLDIQLRPTVQAEDAISTAGLARQAEPLKVSPYALKLAEVMQEICAGNPAAAEWWAQLVEAADVYDHLIDRDPMDSPETIDRVFESLCLHWPLNGFFRQFAHVLVPVMSAAISAWKSDPKGYRVGDVYTESANAICFLLHGNYGVKKWMPLVRSLVRQLRNEDMKKDGR